LIDLLRFPDRPPVPGSVVVLQADRAALQAMQPVLSPEEKVRAEAILHEAARSRFVEGRTLLRMSLGRMLGIDPLMLPLRISPQGKPHLPPTWLNLRFSLAVGEFHVLVAAGPDAEVGVDIEETVPPDFEAVANVIMSAGEIADFRSLPLNTRADAFLRAWTRKEAVLKAYGTGLLIDPRTVDVGINPSAGTVVLDEPRMAIGWADCPAIPAAVAAAGGPFALEIIKL
jgi:4'-phosphopantetheinyl transferase